MSRTVFMHVGLPKSGTTYLQSVLGKNKTPLKQRAGLLYPGESWGRQVAAVKDVRRLNVRPAQRSTVEGAWDRLVAEMRAWSGDVVVSMEWLCMASRPQISRIAEDLAGSEVHVVFTVRDVARTVPAVWQEFCQNRSTWRWPEFLEQVTGEAPMDTPAGRAFWAQQDMELLLDQWTSVLPAERVHVVTLPQSGADPSELWRRMAGVLGIDPDGYDLSDLGSNASLGMESAELMRRINVRLRELGTPVPDYNSIFKRRLAKQVLAARKGEETKVLLPGEYHDWARAKAEAQVEAIKRSGVQVVGDLDELRPLLDRGRTEAVATEPAAEAVVDAAVQALVTFALEPPLRKRRPKATNVPPATAARSKGPVRRARLGWVGRVRGRLPFGSALGSARA